MFPSNVGGRLESQASFLKSNHSMIHGVKRSLVVYLLLNMILTWTKENQDNPQITSPLFSGSPESPDIWLNIPSMAKIILWSECFKIGLRVLANEHFDAKEVLGEHVVNLSYFTAEGTEPWGRWIVKKYRVKVIGEVVVGSLLARTESEVWGDLRVIRL